MVYLLHFSRPIGNAANPKGQARHYIGFANDGHLDERVRQHQTGVGARITKAAVAAGITLTVARTWDGGLALERKLKRAGHGPKLCPICRAERAAAPGGS